MRQLVAAEFSDFSAHKLAVRGQLVGITKALLSDTHPGASQHLTHICVKRKDFAVKPETLSQHAFRAALFYVLSTYSQSS